MGVQRTRTIKNKHAAAKSGIKGSKASKRGAPDGVVTKKNKKAGGSTPVTSTAKGRPGLSDALKKRKRRVYSEAELGIPKLNMVTPIGVVKPRGKKKGKTFVDDRESMATIMAIVQAEKEGQIESKVMKARQMEEIREARRAEAEKKEEERKAKLNDTKESLRKKRKRRQKEKKDDVGGDDVKDVSLTGTKPAKKKKVAFA